MADDIICICDRIYDPFYAVGLWYDDYTAGSANPVTSDLISVLTYSTGVGVNDKPFKSEFPYVAAPWRGTETSFGN